MTRLASENAIDNSECNAVAIPSEFATSDLGCHRSGLSVE